MTPAALREAFSLQRELDGLLAQPHISKEQRKRADIVMSRIASLRDVGMSTDEAHRALAAEYGREISPSPEQRAHEDLFKAFLRGVPESEIEREARALVTGTQSIIYSAGQNGGFLVQPISMRTPPKVWQPSILFSTHPS